MAWRRPDWHTEKSWLYVLRRFSGHRTYRGVNIHDVQALEELSDQYPTDDAILMFIQVLNHNNILEGQFHTPEELAPLLKARARPTRR